MQRLLDLRLAGHDALEYPLALRLAARDDVIAIVNDWTGSLNRDELLERCLAAQVPIGAGLAFAATGAAIAMLSSSRT